MNQTTNGLEELEQQLNGILDEYSKNKQIYLPTTPPAEIQNYINMGRDYIESLPRESCYSIAILLSQYALYIQRIVNREKARIKWTNSVITNLCARHWDEYDSFIKADIKIALIAKENEVVRKLISVKNNAEIRVEDLDHLASTIDRMGYILEKSAYGKK